MPIRCSARIMPDLKPAGSDAIYAQCTDGGKEGIYIVKTLSVEKETIAKTLKTVRLPRERYFRIEVCVFPETIKKGKGTKDVRKYKKGN